MEKFVKGEVVVLPFPFSDLSSSKKRPALVLASLDGDDVILCQITSEQTRKDKYSIDLNDSDFGRKSKFTKFDQIKSDFHCKQFNHKIQSRQSKRKQDK